MPKDNAADDMDIDDDVCRLGDDMDINKGDVESASAHLKRGPPLKEKGVNVPLYSNPRSKRHSRVVPTTDNYLNPTSML